MIRVDFTSAAQSELTELIRFYDRQGGTIASDLATELERVVERICEFPDAGAPYSSGTRRILLYRFPVAVVYRARGSTLEVVALAHQRRRPDYWVLRERRRLYSRSVAELPGTGVLASEQTLADWARPEEDEAWRHLQPER